MRTLGFRTRYIRNRNNLQRTLIPACVRVYAIRWICEQSTIETSPPETVDRWDGDVVKQGDKMKSLTFGVKDGFTRNCKNELIRIFDVKNWGSMAESCNKGTGSHLEVTRTRLNTRRTGRDMFHHVVHLFPIGVAVAFTSLSHQHRRRHSLGWSKLFFRLGPCRAQVQSMDLPMSYFLAFQCAPCWPLPRS